MVIRVNLQCYRVCVHISEVRIGEGEVRISEGTEGIGEGVHISEGTDNDVID